MKDLAEAVEHERARLGPDAGLGVVTSAWARAVGTLVAANAWPARLARDGTLHVATSSSAWAFELTMLEATMRAGLREELGKGAPPRLSFAVGRLPEPGGETVSTSSRTAPIPTAAERAEADAIARAIDNCELRKAVSRAVAAGLAAARSGIIYL